MEDEQEKGRNDGRGVERKTGEREGRTDNSVNFNIATTILEFLFHLQSQRSVIEWVRRNLESAFAPTNLSLHGISCWPNPASAKIPPWKNEFELDARLLACQHQAAIVFSTELNDKIRNKKSMIMINPKFEADVKYIIILCIWKVNWILHFCQVVPILQSCGLNSLHTEWRLLETAWSFIARVGRRSGEGLCSLKYQLIVILKSSKYPPLSSPTNITKFRQNSMNKNSVYITIFKKLVNHHMFPPFSQILLVDNSRLINNKIKLRNYLEQNTAQCLVSAPGAERWKSLERWPVQLVALMSHSNLNLSILGIFTAPKAPPPPDHTTLSIKQGLIFKIGTWIWLLQESSSDYLSNALSSYLLPSIDCPLHSWQSLINHTMQC